MREMGRAARPQAPGLVSAMLRAPDSDETRKSPNSNDQTRSNQNQRETGLSEVLRVGLGRRTEHRSESEARTPHVIKGLMGFSYVGSVPLGLPWNVASRRPAEQGLHARSRLPQPFHHGPGGRSLMLRSSVLLRRYQRARLTPVL